MDEIGERHVYLCCMNLEDLESAILIGQRDLHVDLDINRKMRNKFE